MPSASLRTLATVLTLIAALTTRAQTPTQTAPPTFEVASIRPMHYDHTARTHIYNSPRDGNFKAQNVTAKALLEVAYELPDTQMFGGPPWASADKFDLDAKSDAEFNEGMAALPTDRARQRKREMLKALLADRFKLVVHTESREMPIYALVAAKGGSKLVPSNVSGTTINTGKSRITIRGSDNFLALLTYELSWRLGRPVLDQTGLAGRYEFTLTWTPDDAPPEAADGPSLFTAIQEQLGLKLEPAKGPVPVLVIDHVEQPTPN